MTDAQLKLRQIINSLDQQSIHTARMKTTFYNIPFPASNLQEALIKGVGWIQEKKLPDAGFETKFCMSNKKVEALSATLSHYENFFRAVGIKIEFENFRKHNEMRMKKSE